MKDEILEQEQAAGTEETDNLFTDEFEDGSDETETDANNTDEQNSDGAKIGNINRFTGDIMSDEADVEMYNKMLDMQRQGYDPVEDSVKYEKEQLKNKQQQQNQQKPQTEGTAGEAGKNVGSDIEKFAKENPKIKIGELLNNAEFIEFCDGKVGRVPLTELFEKFSKSQADNANETKQQAQKIASKKSASPGALSNGNGATKVDYSTMSDEEYSKKLDAVLRGTAKI